MAYREVSVTEIREVLRLWVRGKGLRAIAQLVALDRKTVRRYVDAAVAAGLVRDGGEAQLTDELIGVVVEQVRPARPRGRGEAWERCQAERAQIKEWLDADVPVVKIGDLLARRGKQVPERTLHRLCAEEQRPRRVRVTRGWLRGARGRRGDRARHSSNRALIAVVVDNQVHFVPAQHSVVITRTARPPERAMARSTS